MKKTIMIVAAFGLAVGLSACGGGGGESESENTGDTSSSEARTIYVDNCASCHGENLEGNSGPSLENIGSDMSKEEILAQIENGGNGMPPAIIQGEEAEQVASWLASKK